MATDSQVMFNDAFHSLPTLPLRMRSKTNGCVYRSHEIRQAESGKKSMFLLQQSPQNDIKIFEKTKMHYCPIFILPKVFEHIVCEKTPPSKKKRASKSKRNIVRFHQKDLI